MRSRRAFLGQTIAASVLTQLPGLTLARSAGDSRLVLVILRGALDGLSAVPPYADPDYVRARAELAIAAPGAGQGALQLDGSFGLHPSLDFLHQRYGLGELIVFHAAASPYRERSHFDGQNVLENGTPKPTGAASGWLNRALAGIPPQQRGTGREAGLALSQNLPLILRGSEPVTSWAPSVLPEVDPDFLQRLASLYDADPVLATRLKEATDIDLLADDQPSMRKGAGGFKGRAGGVQRLKLMAETAGKLLSANDGPRVAVLESTGWDTHAQEGAAGGQLAARLQGLDAVLATLAGNLGTAWKETAVVVVTEFGRTIAINGSRGTDHGTASCAWLLGGAVQGGRVIADWPGLAAGQRYEGRDLKPTLDLRSVFKTVLHEHLQVSGRYLDEVVFPDSKSAAPLRDLMRA